MKRRMAFLLALVMALALAIGVMPAAADTTISLAVGGQYLISANGYTHYEISAGGVGVINVKEQQETIDGKEFFGVTAIGSGNATVTLTNSSTPSTRAVYHFTVSRASGELAELSNSTATFETTYYNSYNDIYVGEEFSVRATIKNNGRTDISDKVRYSWSVSNTSKASLELVSGGSSQTARFKVKSAPSNGADVGSLITLTVTGSNGVNAIGGYSNHPLVRPAYGGEVSLRYFDSENGTQYTDPGAQLASTEKLYDLSRTFTFRSGTSVGVVSGKVIDRAVPGTITFGENKRTAEADIFVRDATAWDNRPTQPDYGSMGYVVLNQYYANNPYVIMVGIEAMNNLKAMNVGDTQQITADMLGGVPVNAPGMSYKVADESIADVTQSGLVRGKKAGMTMLRVFCGDHEVINKQIFVLGSGTAFEDDPIIDEDGLYFGITSVTRSLEEKGDVRFRVSAKNLSVDGEKIGHDEVEWTSSDTSVARVDDEGYVSIRKVGECYIYGTYTNEDGKEFTSRFKVVVEE